MTVSYPLRLFYDCSNAHLSPETRTHLDARANHGGEMIAATPYGWFVWVGTEPRPDHPADLELIMDRARQLGAEYILFDRDAPENDALPIFDD